jgi:hypothetical protein
VRLTYKFELSENFIYRPTRKFEKSESDEVYPNNDAAKLIPSFCAERLLRHIPATLSG